MNHPAALALAFLALVVWALGLSLQTWGPPQVSAALGRARRGEWIGFAVVAGGLVALVLL